MNVSVGKITAICFVGSLLLIGTTAEKSQTTSSGQSSPPASTPPPADATPSTSTAQSTSDQPVDEWPEGPSCHPPDFVIGRNLDTRDWTDELNQMINNGAQGSNDDFSAILQYLVTNFGPMPA